MPAGGASTTRFGIVTSPMQNGSRSERILRPMLEQPLEHPAHVIGLMADLAPGEPRDSPAGGEGLRVAPAVGLERSRREVSLPAVGFDGEPRVRPVEVDLE